MRKMMILGAAAAAFLALPGGAEAARSCLGDGAAAGCAARSAIQGQQVAQRQERRRYEPASAPPPRRPAPAYAEPRGSEGSQPIYPNRPYWSSPYECYTDDGNGRFRPCNAGGIP